MKYYGGDGTGSIVYWNVATSKGTFHVYVNTGASAQSFSPASGSKTFIDAGTTASNAGTLQPFSTCVVKSQEVTI